MVVTLTGSSAAWVWEVRGGDYEGNSWRRHGLGEGKRQHPEERRTGAVVEFQHLPHIDSLALISS